LQWPPVTAALHPKASLASGCGFFHISAQQVYQQQIPNSKPLQTATCTCVACATCHAPQSASLPVSRPAAKYKKKYRLDKMNLWRHLWVKTPTPFTTRR